MAPQLMFDVYIRMMKSLRKWKVLSMDCLKRSLGCTPRLQWPRADSNLVARFLSGKLYADDKTARESKTLHWNSGLWALLEEEEDAGAFFTLFVLAWAQHGSMKNPCNVTLVSHGGNLMNNGSWSAYSPWGCFFFQRSLEFYNGHAIWIVSSVSFSFPLSLYVRFAFQDTSTRSRSMITACCCNICAFMGPNWLFC